MYKVIKRFTDLTDNGYAYLSGDTYPREGATPSAERIAELLSDNNRRGEPVIAEYKVFVAEDPKPETVEEEPRPKKRGRKKNAE